MAALYKPYVKTATTTTTTTAVAPSTRVTEFDILKASHKFLREDADADGEANTKTARSWNDQLAQKYYDSLYREFAICDLKHYKSGNFALRWRTETEVIAGTGENTCANARCSEHATSTTTPLLSTLELPFAYEEHGQKKEALVKVVLCSKCVRKLMWKRKHGKRRREVDDDDDDDVEGKMDQSDKVEVQEDRRPPKSRSRSKDVELSDDLERFGSRRRRRSSRSPSPQAHKRKRETSVSSRNRSS